MKKMFLVLVLISVFSLKCNAINVEFEPAKGSETYNFKIVDSSGNAVSGVEYAIVRQSLLGKCSNSLRYKVTSTNDWVAVDLEKDMEIWYVESYSVPDGYQDMTCNPIFVSPSNKNVEIVISKENEVWQKKEVVGVGYNDFIHDDGYVDNIRYAIYLNGNCSGTPYLEGVSGNNLPVYHSLPIDTQMSIKPIEYPSDYLAKLDYIYDRFYCNTFKIKEVKVKAGIPAKPLVLLFGAPIFGAKIGPNGQLVYVDENNSDNNAGTDNNSSGNFANFFIDGEKISSKIDVFLEKNRTYLNIKDLCHYMGCTYQNSNNNIIMKFKINEESVQGLDTSSISIDSIADKITYVVSHKLGSKNYDTYLKVNNYKTFALKSPTFNIDSVDVISLEKNGNIYLPLRFISEALGRYVEYEPAKNGEMPNIIISSMGSGDFYDKYSIVTSFSEYNVGDSVKSENVSSANILLGEKKLFGYGVLNSNGNKKVINKNETIFVPLSNIETKDSIDNNKNSYDNDIIFKSFKLKNNYIMYNNTTSLSKEEPFAIISNIEGYPFVNLVNIK